MGTDDLARLQERLDQAKGYADMDEWTFVGHVLTQLAVEAMTAAEKANDHAHDSESDYDPYA